MKIKKCLIFVVISTMLVACSSKKKRLISIMRLVTLC